MTNLAAYGQSVQASASLNSFCTSTFQPQRELLHGQRSRPLPPARWQHARTKDSDPPQTCRWEQSRKNTQSFVFFLFYLCSLHKQDPRQKQMCICRVFSPCLWVLFVFSLKHHIIRSDPKSPAVQRQAYIDCFIQEHSEGTTPP